MRSLILGSLIPLLAAPVFGQPADLSAADWVSVQTAYMKASNTQANDFVGFSVAASGDTVVVAGSGESSGATGVNGDQNDNSAALSGAVYVFVRDGASWTQQAYLKASNTGAGDNFGRSVSLCGDTLVVGAWEDDSGATGVDGDGSDNSVSASGAAYVFERVGTTWSQQAYLKASNTDATDLYGISVGVCGDTVVVGSHLEDSNATGVNGDDNDDSAGSAGAAYVYVRDGSTWTQQAYLKGLNTEAGDQFGHSVAISGETIVVGARGEDSGATGVNAADNNAAGNSGATYVFVRDDTTWTQQAYLKAANTGGNDNFGYAVALDDELLVVGAYAEDSNATGVDGDGSNNSTSASGAAYLFRRSEESWSQEAYLKASNPDVGDSFGWSVAVGEGRVAVAANQERSAATGVDGDQADNTKGAAGAAYVFVPDGTSWSQQAYLKATNTDSEDRFGQSIAVWGDTVVVGARREDSNATGIDGDGSDNSATWAGAAYSYVFSAWEDLGNALAGTGGLEPLLVGTGTLIGGTPVSLDLSDARADSSAALVLGLSATFAPLKGGVLVPAPDLVRYNNTTDAFGELHIEATWPEGVPAGFELWVQLWVTDPVAPVGYAASNAVRGEAP